MQLKEEISDEVKGQVESLLENEGFYYSLSGGGWLAELIPSLVNEEDAKAIEKALEVLAEFEHLLEAEFSL